MIDVAAALAELAALDRPALGNRWELAFNNPPPKGCQATLLRQALAWHIQMQVLQSKVGTRGARRSAQALRQAASAPTASTLALGTRLLREWQGRTHHITVVDGGFEYDGHKWSSLSAIAKSITGTPWSGPLFFGLRK
ncbi:MAG: DUF2924 domain-containing protein [Rubrivivax sp.]